jgi:PPOX class probable F420-dependent enzyme
VTRASVSARVRRGLVLANKYLLEALRDDQADSVLDLPVGDGGFASLAGHAHCLLVTYRKDGRPVAQPVWPGFDGDTAYVWTEVNAMKAKRLRTNPVALLAPCTFRGRPLGPPVAAIGRVLESNTERSHAAEVIGASWGWKRKAFAWASRPLTDVHYIGLVPAEATSGARVTERLRMRSQMDLTGRTVFVTGAARGIGAGAARRLLGLGANLMLVGLEPERLQALATELGNRAAWAEADVVDEAALSAAVEAAVSRFGRIDVAIANAGLHFVGGVATAPTRLLERELLVNLHGTLLTDRAVLPALVETKGYLLNVASLAASLHLPMMGAYAASKAGVEALTDCLRAEVAATGVGVGCAYLGFFDTDLVRGSYAHPSSAPLAGTMPKFVMMPRPASIAVGALVDGVVYRRNRVRAPRYVCAALALRGAIQPLVDRRNARSAGVAEAARRAAADSGQTISEQYELLGPAAEVDRVSRRTADPGSIIRRREPRIRTLR